MKPLTNATINQIVDRVFGLLIDTDLEQKFNGRDRSVLRAVVKQAIDDVNLEKGLQEKD